MPRTQHNPPPAAPDPPAATPDPPEPANPESPDSVGLPAKRREKGALFRALVDAGADEVLAYTADVHTESMVLEIAAAQAHPIIMEMRRIAQEQNARFDRMDARLDRMDARLDTLTQQVVGHDRRLDVLAAQMRLLIAALGVVVTVLIAMFGFLLAR